MSEDLAGRVAALEARLRVVEDREAITALIYRYALCIRLKDTAGCRALLVDEASFDLSHIDPADPQICALHWRIEGADAIVAARDDEAGASASVWPMIHAIEIALNGDSASSRCLSETALWPYGRQYVGEYLDTFRRTQQGWRFVTRHYRLYGDTNGTLAADASVIHTAEKC